MRYTLSKHALDRLKLRFGVKASKAAEWINNKMKNAKYVSTSGNRMLYEHGGVQIVIGAKDKKVITIHHEIRTDFLRPTLEREIRKLKRETTRLVRIKERQLAESYAEMGAALMNFANARNPMTREGIGEKIDDMNKNIEAIVGEIGAMNDGLNAKIKAIEVIME